MRRPSPVEAVVVAVVVASVATAALAVAVVVGNAVAQPDPVPTPGLRYCSPLEGAAPDGQPVYRCGLPVADGTTVECLATTHALSCDWARAKEDER